MQRRRRLSKQQKHQHAQSVVRGGGTNRKGQKEKLTHSLIHSLIHSPTHSLMTKQHKPPMNTNSSGAVEPRNSATTLRLCTGSKLRPSELDVLVISSCVCKMSFSVCIRYGSRSVVMVLWSFSFFLELFLFELCYPPPPPTPFFLRCKNKKSGEKRKPLRL